MSPSKTGIRTARFLQTWTRVILGLPLLAAAWGQTDSAPSEIPPGVHIRIEAVPRIATVGDPIRLDFYIEMPAGYRAEIPAMGHQAGDFSILEFLPGPAVSGSGQPGERPSSPPAGHHARIVAAVYKTGPFTFPPVPIRLLTSEGKRIIVSSPPVAITIQSVLAGKDSGLIDLKKQVELPEPSKWHFRLAALLAACAAGALAWLFWKRRRARASSLPEPPPLDVLGAAESELRSLLARGFPEDRQVKPFYVELSEIVKKILGAGFGVQTAERTTEEIMEALRRGTGRSPQEMEIVESFLVRCDLVKFAKYVPSTAEHQYAADAAFRMLDLSRRLLPAAQEVHP